MSVCYIDNSNNMPWRKIRSDFDVTMCSFDGAETCELIGLFLLSQLTHLDVNVGLYRYDGLATSTKSPKEVEAIKKEMWKIFKHNSLQITIEANKKVVDFLDITLNLRTYKKSNSDLTYIQKQSNHPLSIIENLPKSINKRLSTNSKNALIFNEACPPHPETLKKNGYNTDLQFDRTCTDKNNEKNKTRKRKITWFNPPFNINVATNVAKTLLALIDKNFPKDKRLCKIFNRNTATVNYSCLPNVKQTICNNHHRLLQLHRMKESTQDSKLCNCRQKNSCPFDGKHLTKCVVYKATVTETTSNNHETYIGLIENEFKTIFKLHESSFKVEHKRTSTTLSEHIWKLKNKNIHFNIKWEVFKKVKPFAPSHKVCKLCLQEKLSILRSGPSLNKTSAIFLQCIHRKKFLLINTNNPLSTDEGLWPETLNLDKNYRLIIFNRFYIARIYIEHV